MYSHYTPTDTEHFWSKVDKSNGDDGCWIYRTTARRGYGRIKWGGRMEQSYRVSYLLAYGQLPDDLKVYRTCETPSCVNPKHLVLEMRDEERFWSKVNVTDPDKCWEWTAGRNENGYGTLNWQRRKMEKAHRVSWIVAHGDIPKGLEICHSCDNPPCCNPSHLFLGTHNDNIQDMIAKGRLVVPRGEKHGNSRFSDAQVVEMRKLHQEGQTPAQLSRLFGISKTHIHSILKGKVRI